MAVVTIKDVVEVVAVNHGTSKAKAEEILRTVLNTIQSNLALGDEVFLSGFGKFKPELRQAREGRNPKTGESIEIPERTVIKFKPAKALEEFINKFKQRKINAQ